jgi:hypothetical protein
VSALPRTLGTLLALVLLAARAGAWPADTMMAIARDARRLLPRSLGRLLDERETYVQQESLRLPPQLVRALSEDLSTGTLRPATIALADGEIDRVAQLFRTRRVSEGLVRLGGLLRIPADLSDPALAAGPEGWPPGLAREYYALFADNIDRMPVVLDDPKALETTRQELPALWQALLERSRAQVPTVRAELLRAGRVVSHRTLDYRSPAWAVASLAYSRAVTATAATWLAVWRDSRGDTTNMRQPKQLVPREPVSAANDRRPPAPEAP